MDDRVAKLAKNLVNYSVGAQAGEKILVSYEGECTKPLVLAVIREIYAAGALPYAEARDSRVLRAVLLGATEPQLEWQNECSLHQMKGMDGFIAIRAGDNTAELADVPAEQMALYSKTQRPTLDYRVNHTKWVVLRYPTPSMAQLAQTSQDAFEDFYFNVCNLDYGKMSRAMDALVAVMERTDRGRIVSPGTDLSFRIGCIPAIKCAGEKNIPDGEVYTAPVRDSVNGRISYNTQSEEQGCTYENIVFDVKDGRIVDAHANDDARINSLLDTDEGARHFGEFAIGVNPFILHPMKDTLFDEKIAGSIHLTPGASYEDAFNGNKSAVHWDLVLIQRPEYGGGELWFDDVLVRKDGLFVLPELEVLNPENLK